MASWAFVAELHSWYGYKRQKDQRWIYQIPNGALCSKLVPYAEFRNVEMILAWLQRKAFSEACASGLTVAISLPTGTCSR